VQLSHLKLRRWSERMRAGLQLFSVLLGTMIGLAEGMGRRAGARGPLAGGAGKI